MHRKIVVVFLRQKKSNNNNNKKEEKKKITKERALTSGAQAAILEVARLASTLAAYVSGARGARHALAFVATLAHELALVALALLRVEPRLAHTDARARRRSAYGVVRALLAIHTPGKGRR